MANYTDTELESAVSRYVRGNVNTERSELGPLNVDYSFTEAREFTASTLVFDPGSVFYLLSLAANRVNQDVLLGLDYVDDILTAIDEVGVDTTDVAQTSLLEDAASALIDAERTITDSGNLTPRPFERYERALDTFIGKSLTPNIRRVTGSTFPDTYEIVRPPQKAQAAIKTTIASLRELHSTILSEAAQLMVALSEFLAANLPLESVQNSVPKVRKDLRTLKGAFDAATVDGAIEITRDAYLSIQAGRSVVTNLLSITDPRSARMSSSASSSDRAKAASISSESSPAEISTGISAPYLITPTTNEVRIGADGGAEQLVSLPIPERGSILCQIGETYDIHDASRAALVSSAVGPYTIPAAPDNLFSIYVDGVGYQVALTVGSRTASQIASEINTSPRIDGEPGSFFDVGTASGAGGILTIIHDTVGAGELAVSESPILAPALPFVSDSSEGQDANNELRLVVDFTNIVVVSLTEGLRTASQVAADISTSPLLEAGTEALETDGGTITVVRATSLAYGEGSYVSVESSTAAQEAAAETLGFSEGQMGQGAYLSLTELQAALEAMSGLELGQSLELLQSGLEGEAVYDSVYKLRLPVGTLQNTFAGDTLVIANGENAGNYPISMVTFGAYDEITVGRPFKAVSGDAAQNQEWSVRHDVLYIRSATSSTASQVAVAIATANVALNLTVGSYFGLVSGIRIQDGNKELNFSRNDVRVGDIFTLDGPTYQSTHTVTDVTYDGYQVEVTPWVSSDLTGHEYSVESSGAVSYAAFDEEMDTWNDDFLSPSKFTEDIQELERVLNPLLINKNPSAALVGTARMAAISLREVYSVLSTTLADFTAPRYTRIDSLLDMMSERGLDRAHDLLLLGEFEEFFGSTKDGSSYSGNLLEKMRAIAQNDVPQGRTLADDNVDDRLSGSFDEADSNFDFSDQDDEGGELEIDDVPDADEDEESLYGAV